MSGSAYGKGPYGAGKYSRAASVNDAAMALRQPTGIRFSADLLPIAPSDLAPIVNYTQIRVAGVILRVGMHVIEQPATMQLSGQTLWEKTTVPACQPWFFVGLPASWRATPNTAGAMFP
jgi:hypothetical protein